MSTSRARVLLLGGVVGPPLFVAVFLLDSFIHPAYNPVTDFVSELSRGELGWLQIANFIVLALLLLGFAVGIPWAVRRGPGSIAGALIFAVIALGLFFAGLFVTDAHTETQETTSGMIHGLASLPVFAGLIVVSFVFARRFHGRMRAYSIATGLFVLVFFVGTVVVGGPLDIMGIVQRITIIAGWAWITVLALELRAEPAPTR